MNRQSSHIVLSKSVLQNLNYHLEIEKVLDQIYRHVCREAMTRKTNYKYDIACTFPHGHGPMGLNLDVFITGLLSALVKEFPDCKIEPIKTYGYENKIVEHFIVIDWS